MEERRCVLNGRICPLNDNYTSVLIRGKSVVDYIVTCHECLKPCSEFKGIKANQIVEAKGCMHPIDERSKLPNVLVEDFIAEARPIRVDSSYMFYEHQNFYENHIGVMNYHKTSTKCLFLFYHRIART